MMTAGTVKRVRILTAILVAILAAFVLARAFPARAHGDYDWIRKHYGEALTAQSGGWKDGDFGGCCGKQDCFPVDAAFKQRDGVYGWDIRDAFGGWIPDKDTRPSHDPQGRHWRCYVMKRDMALGLVPSHPRTDASGKPCFFPSRGDF